MAADAAFRNDSAMAAALSDGSAPPSRSSIRTGIPDHLKTTTDAEMKYAKILKDYPPSGVDEKTWEQIMKVNYAPNKYIAAAANNVAAVIKGGDAIRIARMNQVYGDEPTGRILRWAQVMMHGDRIQADLDDRGEKTSASFKFGVVPQMKYDEKKGLI